MVLAYAAVAEVEGLLKQKLSYREIAARTGVGRTKVSEIARRVRQVTRMPASDADARPAWRCPKCGRKITSTRCIACAAEEALQPKTKAA